MTATQVFLLFLKKKCSRGEYFFFRDIIMHNRGNKYFKKRPLFKEDFVERYLSNNGRTLYGFMTRIFILVPNLVRLYHKNPIYKELANVSTLVGSKTPIFIISPDLKSSKQVP